MIHTDQTAMDRLEKARRTHRRPDRLEDMDTHQLQEEKTAIKRELKAFDHEFQKKHGHMVLSHLLYPLL